MYSGNGGRGAIKCNTDVYICTHCAICMCCLCVVWLACRGSAQDYTHSLTSSREDGEYSECVYVGSLMPSMQSVP